ncbi:hypothetical protein DL93DRAFT_2072659, partial [Clavulina sp. PMI_390]
MCGSVFFAVCDVPDPYSFSRARIRKSDAARVQEAQLAKEQELSLREEPLSTNNTELNRSDPPFEDHAAQLQSREDEPIIPSFDNDDPPSSEGGSVSPLSSTSLELTDITTLPHRPTRPANPVSRSSFSSTSTTVDLDSAMSFVLSERISCSYL